MDELDQQLLRYLTRDSRLPVASLASATGVSRATVKSRIDRLVETGMIKAFTIETGAGFRAATVRAFVQVEVTGRMADRVTQQLLRIAEVETVHSTNGRWDLIAELEASDLRSFDEVLRQIRLIDGVNLTESNILLSSRRSAVL
ncbi:Lrp/AsnC family transcriptional regulator [Rhizorhabdus wittichii]|uniref:Transcriptional regulator, AsnC family n=2 Tax=Rhizorhabdus wittichii TaxID=160791 RepID=A0A9J9LDW2_RHIWR|nr:Lrp/AsnC family transcriptional regulator [Rhizorhabdus wittichii]ABQ67416.1 transcriptional regulator, AsnC family [Rhizorhabdus wittichii RW1]ARR55792.1 AsnC family transcriptional regulator [Rhizorhabdus wittichii DC-6]QTH23411.1 Lrp/AsnC family transcriptional regulator [Rhizorhabdus wittichii]